MCDKDNPIRWIFQQNRDKKMTKTFRELYKAELRKPTPASVFVSRVAEATKRKENTVRMWVAGRQQPDKLARERIAELLGVEADGLFPDNTENAITN